ncbi:hypothetical protein FE374_01615 [Georgenia yuyongxinii]|uniref:Histidine kinase/HSP90-like ATPase domain-containing protein n=1 Tax=Georgenia yuyongxinii TaxID=2589797 RepID=A0A5B8C0F4_9MICO|nr:histidine kinase [Georgenia yuyongxinii]QDC23500.1 hypothetical protein FE374_01615 [Georgenia yuyongxinii]
MDAVAPGIVAPTVPATAPVATARWSALARAGILAAALAAAALFALSVPAAIAAGSAVCAASPCPPGALTPAEVAGLNGLGLTPVGYAVAGIVLLSLLVLTYLAVAVLLVRVAGPRPEALTAAAVLVGVGLVFPQTLPALAAASPGWTRVVAVVDAAVLVAFVAWLLTFPTGRFAPRWTALLIALVVLVELAGMVGAGLPGPVETAGTVALLGVVVLVVLSRYHRTDPAGRSQARWVAGAFTIAGTALLVATVAQQALGVGPGTVADLVVQAGIVLSFELVPLAVAAAVLRRGLWDATSAIARTATYALLGVGAVTVYLVVVAIAVTVALDPTGAAVVAAGAVAVAVHPAFLAVRAVVNRALYGTRDDPAVLLAALTTAPGTGHALETAVATLRRSLRLAAVEITLPGGEVVHAGTAPATAPRRAFGLVHAGTPVGELVLVGEPDRASRHALDPTLAHLGVLAHATTLDRRLAHSYRALVSAREEERRRIRNDLHDGLGPTLGAVRLSLAAAGNHLATDPARAAALLEDARRHVGGAVVEVRRLVYGLRPPALDELGLVGALTAFTRTASTMPVEVRADDAVRRAALPAAIEVAAYRIAVEAVANAWRHSSGTRCEVRVELQPGALRLTVRDDGSGGAPTAGPDADAPDGARLQGTPGVGTTSMLDRARELGGSVRIASDVHGTVVTASLPLPEPSDPRLPKPAGPRLPGPGLTKADL